MSDLEFDLLDELYFVQDFAYLKATLRWEEETLVDTCTSFMKRDGSNVSPNPIKNVLEKLTCEEMERIYCI